MPWLVGMDEAGLGPNLGPLVLASVALCIDEPKDLWTALDSVIRRKQDKANKNRLLIDDSKKVHQGVNGFLKLEQGVLATFQTDCSKPISLGDWLFAHAVGSTLNDLQEEPWFDPTEEVPLESDPEIIQKQIDVWPTVYAKAGIQAPPRLHILAIPAPRFNRILDQHSLKTAVQIDGVTELFQQLLHLPGNEAIHVSVDKLGGRNQYAALLRTIFPDGLVRTLEEKSERSAYQIYGLSREMEIVFEPRADTSALTVALASMACKYLREICMVQFNRYWETLIPGLQPTAGYPVDALRFWADIQAYVEANGIVKDRIWRKK